MGLGYHHIILSVEVLGMDQLRKDCRKVEVHYAAVQGSYCGALVFLTGFVAMFLSWLGLSDSQIGLMNSTGSALTIMGQLLVGAYLDKHPDVSIKKTILKFCLLASVGAAALYWISLPTALGCLVFLGAYTCAQTTGALVPSLMMRFVNVGLPVDFGWPRGIGSICWASLAYVMGGIIERYSARVLMLGYVVGIVLVALALRAMPDVEEYAGKGVPEDRIIRSPIQKKPSGGYFEMLRANPTLLLFCTAAAICFAGQTPVTVFQLRIIEGLGGGAAQFGTVILIQSGMELPIMMLSARIMRYIKPKYLLVICFFSYVVRHFLYANVTAISQYYAVCFISVLCYGIWGVASVIFANQIVPHEQTTRAQSLASFSVSIGGIIGSTVSGMLIEKMGMAFTLALGWKIILCAACLMALCARLCKKKLGI